MTAWERTDATTITKVGHRTIITKTFKMPDGAVSEFETYDVEGRQYVAVVALTEDNAVIIARQFRAGPQKVMDELPGGGVEVGESLEQAARRELLEEACYEPGKLQFIGSVHKDEKFNAVHHYFVAFDCRKVAAEQQLDVDEHIDVVLISIDELLKNGRTGATTEVSGIYLALPELEKRLQT